MRLCKFNMLCLCASALASSAISWAQSPDGLVVVIFVPYLVPMAMVWYVGRRDSVAGIMNYVTLVISTATAILWPLCLSLQGTEFQMLWAFILFGSFAANLILVPLICLLTHLAVKQNATRRGFPVLPLPPRNG